MKHYRITYKDCGEISMMNLKAYDFDHVEEKFWDSIEDWQGDHLGIELMEIVFIKN